MVHLQSIFVLQLPVNETSRFFIRWAFRSETRFTWINSDGKRGSKVSKAQLYSFSLDLSQS